MPENQERRVDPAKCRRGTRWKHRFTGRRKRTQSTWPRHLIAVRDSLRIQPVHDGPAKYAADRLPIGRVTDARILDHAAAPAVGRARGHRVGEGRCPPLPSPGSRKIASAEDLCQGAAISKVHGKCRNRRAGQHWTCTIQPGARRRAATASGRTPPPSRLSRQGMIGQRRRGSATGLLDDWPTELVAAAGRARGHLGSAKPVDGPDAARSPSGR